jgi:hypothetical protein
MHRKNLLLKILWKLINEHFYIYYEELNKRLKIYLIILLINSEKHNLSENTLLISKISLVMNLWIHFIGKNKGKFDYMWIIDHSLPYRVQNISAL